MIVLGLTTSTPRGGVAVCRDGNIVSVQRYVEPRGHGERLFEALDRAVRDAGIAPEILSAIGCDVGPGSFTGLRVALSAAQGVSLARDLPLVGVGSLEAMAFAAFELEPRSLRVVAFVDAHKGEVFSAALAWKDGDVVAEEPPRAFSPEAAADRARAAHERGDLVVGEVVEQFAPGIAFRDPATDLPDAGVIAAIASKRLASAAQPQGIEAVYGREPDVTRATPRRAIDGLDSATNVGSSGRDPA